MPVHRPTTSPHRSQTQAHTQTQDRTQTQGRCHLVTGQSRRGPRLVRAVAMVVTMTMAGALSSAGAGASTTQPGGGSLADRVTVTTTTAPRSQTTSRTPTTAAPKVPVTTPAPTTPTLPAPTLAAPSLADLSNATFSAPDLSSAAATLTQFRTLSAGLVNYYAHDAGMTVDAYFARNAATFDQVVSSNRAEKDGSGSGSASSTKANAPRNVAELDTALAGQLGLSGTMSYQGMLDSLSGATTTPDGQVVMTAMDLARNLGGVSSLGSDGLLFGLFANRSLANLAGNFPADFAAASRLGLNTPSIADSWGAAQAAAGMGLNGDLSSSMLSPCQAAMMAAMASGAAGGLGSGQPGCGSCVTAGVYMHSAMNRLINPTAASVGSNPGDGTLSTYEWDNLADWQQQAVLRSNPGLQSQLTASLAGSSAANSASAACASSSAGTTNYLSSNLGGLISGLGG